MRAPRIKVALRQGEPLQLKACLTIKGLSVPPEGGSGPFPLWGHRFHLRGGSVPFPLRVCIIVGPWGLELSGFRGVPENVGPQIA